ncbi:UNVERIFIED_CONTAM: hypothetical protein PVV62_26600, partial [Salmonella enterica subsp. enterica serovar Rissen]
YKRLSRRVPALMTGWLLCILGSGYVSMALEQPDSTVLLSLLLLYVMSGILLMQFQYMYSERSIGYKFYLEVLMNAAASTQHKEQLQYLFINKPNSITMGDLYRLYDFNGGGR